MTVLLDRRGRPPLTPSSANRCCRLVEQWQGGTDRLRDRIDPVLRRAGVVLD